MSRLYVLPIPVKRALRWNKAHHRRLPALQGAMWAIVVMRGGVVEDGVTLADRVVGTAIVGRPTARKSDSQEEPQPALQVLRVACVAGDESASGHKGSNSMLYGACARAARAMGCRSLCTYIHDDESGVSLVAAGWILDETFDSKGGEWDRPSRRRAKTVEAGPKLRYFAPWSIEVQGREPGRAA